MSRWLSALLLVAAVGLATNCSSTKQAGGGGTGGGSRDDDDGGVAADAPSVQLFADAALLNLGGKDALAQDAQPMPPASVTFVAPPGIACTNDAACTIPPPVCGEMCVEAGCQTTPWLAAFDRPRCENGHCVYDRRYMQCDWRCWQGRCSIPLTF